MKDLSLSFPLIITLLALGLSSCNSDVFIEPIEISPDRGEVGPDNKTLFIGISGNDWYVKDIWYYDEEGSISPKNDNGVYRVRTAFTELDMEVKSNGLEIHLTNHLGLEPGTLWFAIMSDEYGYEFREVNISVLPTGTYDIKIEDVSYDLYSWSGYPDQDFTNKVVTYSYPNGLSEATSFVFPALQQAPMLYLFESISDNIFVRRVLNSGIAVPIPTYAPFAGKPDQPWIMNGQEAGLTTYRSVLMTPCLPPVPEAVELPAGKPLEVSLIYEYECVGLHCTIKAVNPATELTETIKCELRLTMPKKQIAEVVYL